MTKKQKGVLRRRRLFSIIVCLILIVFSVGIGVFFYPEEVKMYGLFTVGDLLTMDTSGLADNRYLTYVFLCVFCWVLALVDLVWWVFSELKDNDCINHKDCFKCKKYLSCKRKVRKERNY